jgi:hypothetical protein
LDLVLLELTVLINRLKHVPIHKNDPPPKGLLLKILREDIEMSVETLPQLIKH